LQSYAQIESVLPHAEGQIMNTIKNFFKVVDHQTIIVSLLAVGSTWACLYFKLVADIPTGLIGLAVVFPIVFSINTAYKRREEALKYFSGLKAHAVAVYFVHRDWVPGEDGKESQHAGRIRQIIESILSLLRDDLKQTGRRKENFQKVFEAFSDLSKSHETLRQAKLPANEVSRANQYLSKMMVDYERMRNIANYRTPVSLRAYSSVFLNIFPIAFGPYFATLCLKSESFPAIGYIVAVLYSLVLVTLDNIQEDLEDPFDEVGTDDIKLDVFEQYKAVIAD
jgi:predicted membrane chloride channel (bestrophin family)